MVRGDEAVGAMVLVLLILTVAMAGVAGALLLLQARWALDSVVQAAGEVIARVVPLPVGGPGALRRRVARWCSSCVLVMPSGQRTLPRRLVFRVAPETAHRLVPSADPQLLAADLAMAVAEHARRSKVVVHAGTEVAVVLDPLMQFGWVSGHLPGEALPVAATAAVVVVEPSESTQTSTGAEGPAAPTLTLVPGPTAPAPTRTVRRRGVRTADAPTESVCSITLAHGDRQAVLTSACTTVGRDPVCTLVVDDPKVSRQHARVLLDRGRFLVEDLGSANGTRVNDRYLVPAQPVELRAGDRMTLGSTSTWTVLQVTTEPTG